MIKKIPSSQRTNRGEIATTLTLITLGIMLLGTFLGTQQAVQQAAKNIFSRASTQSTLHCADQSCNISKFEVTGTRSRGAGQFIFKGNLCFSGIEIPAGASFFVNISGKDSTGHTVTVGQVHNPITVPSQSYCGNAGIDFSSITADYTGLCSDLSMTAGYTHRTKGHESDITITEETRHLLCSTPNTPTPSPSPSPSPTPVPLTRSGSYPVTSPEPTTVPADFPQNCSYTSTVKVVQEAAFAGSYNPIKIADTDLQKWSYKNDKNSRAYNFDVNGASTYTTTSLSLPYNSINWELVSHDPGYRLTGSNLHVCRKIKPTASFSCDQDITKTGDDSIISNVPVRCSGAAVVEVTGEYRFSKLAASPTPTPTPQQFGDLEVHVVYFNGKPDSCDQNTIEKELARGNRLYSQFQAAFSISADGPVSKTETGPLGAAHRRFNGLPIGTYNLGIDAGSRGRFVEVSSKCSTSITLQPNITNKATLLLQADPGLDCGTENGCSSCQNSGGDCGPIVNGGAVLCCKSKPKHNGSSPTGCEDAGGTCSGQAGCGSSEFVGWCDGDNIRHNACCKAAPTPAGVGDQGTGRRTIATPGPTIAGNCPVGQVKACGTCVNPNSPVCLDCGTSRGCFENCAANVGASCLTYENQTSGQYCCFAGAKPFPSDRRENTPTPIASSQQCGDRDANAGTCVDAQQSRAHNAVPEGSASCYQGSQEFMCCPRHQEPLANGKCGTSLPYIPNCGDLHNRHCDFSENDVRGYNDRCAAEGKVMYCCAEGQNIRDGRCDSGSAGFVGSFEVNNASSKTITNIAVKVCDETGNCEVVNQAVSISSGVQSKISQSLDTLKGLPFNQNKKYSTSCKIIYSDGSQDSCPEKKVSPGDPVRFSLKATATGVTGTAVTQKELADVDKNGRINAQDYAGCLVRYGTSGDNLGCDIDGNSEVNALDLSVVIAHFNESVN